MAPLVGWRSLIVRWYVAVCVVRSTCLLVMGRVRAAASVSIGVVGSLMGVLNRREIRPLACVKDTTLGAMSESWVMRMWKAPGRLVAEIVTVNRRKVVRPPVEGPGSS